jgi:hypothetical protein
MATEWYVMNDRTVSIGGAYIFANEVECDGDDDFILLADGHVVGWIDGGG